MLISFCFDDQDLDDLLNFVRDATNDDTVQEVTHNEDVLASTDSETVPDVVAAKVFVTGVVGRQLGGQIQATGPDGSTGVAEF